MAAHGIESHLGIRMRCASWGFENEVLEGWWKEGDATVYAHCDVVLCCGSK